MATYKVTLTVRPPDGPPGDFWLLRWIVLNIVQVLHHPPLVTVQVQRLADEE